MCTVLLIDADAKIREETRAQLIRLGVSARVCRSEDEVLRCQSGADLVVIGSPPPALDAVRLLRRLRTLTTRPEVIMLARTPDETLEALRLDALYVARPPWTAEEIVIWVERALARTLADSSRAAPLGLSDSFCLLGSSPQTVVLQRQVQQVLQSGLRGIFISGEAGTGKAALALALHASQPSGSRLVPLTTLTPSTLGSLAFSQARPDGRPIDRCTLFVRDVAQVPMLVQERVAAACSSAPGQDAVLNPLVTSRCTLDQALDNGSLSPTLANKVPHRIGLLPMRERVADFPVLFEHALRYVCERLRRPRVELTPTAARHLTCYEWPGNVGELLDVLERACRLSEARHLDVSSLPPFTKRRVPQFVLPLPGVDLRELEREALCQALRRAHGNQTRAASLLGLTRDQIRYRMHKFGMFTRDENIDAA